jgi:SAM-dependent methyltransferase
MIVEHKISPTTRQEFVVSNLDTSKRGIEIAPYFNPMVSKEKFDVWYVDCIDNDEIQKKAKENPGAVGKAVPRIDSVWVPGKPLIECVAGQSFQFAVASHVFEHVPNPLGWVQQILDCINVGGTLALLVPNKLYSMDYYRRETTFADILGWYVDKPSIPTPGQVVDFLCQSFHDLGEVDFTKEMLPFDEAKRLYSDKDAMSFAQMTKDRNYYLDVHCTVWTPDSFVEVFDRIAKLGLLNVELTGPYTGFPGSIPGEFLVYLKKLA